MKVIQQNLLLPHLVQYPPTHNADTKHPAILALHGRGSNEEDLIGLVPYLPKELLWVSPRGTHVLGTNSYEWYRVKIIGKPNPEEVASALQTIDKFIDEILAVYPIDPKRLFILGFSQGSILSMCYALSRPYRVAGVIAQSGYIPQGMNFEVDATNIKDKPFIVTHGEEDALIPVDWARNSRDLLQRLGVHLSYYEFNMGHNISADSIAVIKEWLEKQIG